MRNEIISIFDRSFGPFKMTEKQLDKIAKEGDARNINVHINKQLIGALNVLNENFCEHFTRALVAINPSDDNVQLWLAVRNHTPFPSIKDADYDLGDFMDVSTFHRISGKRIGHAQLYHCALFLSTMADCSGITQEFLTHDVDKKGSLKLLVAAYFNQTRWNDNFLERSPLLPSRTGKLTFTTIKEARDGKDSKKIK